MRRKGRSIANPSCASLTRQSRCSSGTSMTICDPDGRRRTRRAAVPRSREICDQWTEVLAHVSVTAQQIALYAAAALDHPGVLRRLPGEPFEQTGARGAERTSVHPVNGWPIAAREPPSVPMPRGGEGGSRIGGTGGVSLVAVQKEPREAVPATKPRVRYKTSPAGVASSRDTMPSGTSASPSSSRRVRCLCAARRHRRAPSKSTRTDRRAVSRPFQSRARSGQRRAPRRERSSRDSQSCSVWFQWLPRHRLSPAGMSANLISRISPPPGDNTRGIIIGPPSPLLRTIRVYTQAVATISCGAFVDLPRTG